MIAPKDLRKEKMKQSKFIQKPKSTWMFGDAGNPEQMGLHILSKKRKKKK